MQNVLPRVVAVGGEKEMLRHVAPEDLDVFYETRIKPLKARVDAR